MKCIAPIMMLLLLTSIFSKGLIWLEYQANKDYISRNLCANRQKPKLHCNGKCQMVKKMAEESDDDTSTPGTKLKTGIDETALPVASYTTQPALVILSKEHPFITGRRYTSPVFPIFHPPA